MITFTINWHIFNKDDYYLDADWNMRLLWSVFGRRPETLIIERKSSDAEILVTGNLEFVGGGTVQNIKIQNQVIPTGFTNAEIQLNYSLALYNCLQGNALKSCRIQGEITFSEKNGKCISKNYEKDVKVGAEITKKARFSDKASDDLPYINSLLEFSMDFERLLVPNTSYFSDVTLRCGSVSIKAHKIILSARSPVFADILMNQTRDNAGSKVHITDMDVSTFQTMITYIYSGKTGSMSVRSASDLLFASHKYKLRDLKTICINFLKGNISHKNVLKILHIGDLYAKELKFMARDYIWNYCEEFGTLEQTEDWNTLRNARPFAAIDVLTSLIYSREEKLKKCMQREKLQVNKLRK